MRKSLLILAALGAFSLPAAAQNLDEIPATAPTDRGPNEQVEVPVDPNATIMPDYGIDPSTTQSIDGMRMGNPDPVGGAGLDPATNPQSGTFGSNSR